MTAAFVRRPLSITRTAALAAMLFLGFAAGANAAQLKIACEKENSLVPGWSGPMTLHYQGDQKGTLEIRSKHVTLTLPATMRKRPEDSAVVVDAVAEVSTPMPELAAVEACTEKKVPRDLAGDADVYFTTSLSCLSAAPTSKGPVPIKASVLIGLVPPSGAIVEMKQTYLTPSKAPGGKFAIEIFPARCEVTDR